MSINKYLTIVISLFFLSCSFDNKSGIWQEGNEVTNNTKINKNTKRIKVFTETEIFQEEVLKKTNLLLKDSKYNKSWLNEYYNLKNNYQNFKVKDFSKDVTKEKYNLEKVIEPLYYTPLYWTILRCTDKNPDNRQLVYI